MTRRYAFGPFLLDAARGTLTRDGAALAVGQRGLRVLQALLAARGETVLKAELLAAAWPGMVVEDSNLTVQVAALRKLLGSAPGAAEWILTIPRAGYRISEVVAIEDAQFAPIDHTPLEAAGRPGIAVLPFTHLGDDPAQEYLADGLAETLITALTRYRWFFVAGRGACQVYKLRAVDSRVAAAELGVRYLVEGSVRKDGARLRIAAQLVDAHSGHCLWADQYDVADAGLFEVQDTIALQVAGAIEPELLRSIGNPGGVRRGASVSSWDLVAQGAWLFHHVTQPTHLKARELFRQARQVDGELTDAHLWLGRVNAGLVAYGWSDDPANDLSEGQVAALQAVTLDEKNPYAHYALAIVSNYADEFDVASRSAEMAIGLNPSFALGHLVHGMAALYAGRAAYAVKSLERGLGLNRFDPQNFVWSNLLALGCLFCDDSERALKFASMALQVRPTWRPAMRTAAAACAAMGRGEQAVQWARKWSATPALSADALGPLWRCNPAWTRRMELLAPAPPDS
jgi:TolB-like protein